MDSSADTGMRYVGYYYEVKGQVKFSMLGNISIPWRDGRITIACKPFGWMFYLFEGAPHKPPKSFKLERWRVHQLSLDNDCLKIEFRPDAVSIYFKMAEGEKDSEPVKLAFNLIEKILKEDSFRPKGRFGPYPERDVYEAQRVLEILVQQSRSRCIRHILQKAEGESTLSDLSDISDTDLDDEDDVQDKSSTDIGSDSMSKLRPEPLYAVDSIYQAGDLVTSMTDLQSGNETSKKVGESSLADQDGSCSASRSASTLPERKRKNSEKSEIREAENVPLRKMSEGTKKTDASNDLKRKGSKLDSDVLTNSKVKKMHIEANSEGNEPVYLSNRDSKRVREPIPAQSYLSPNYQCSECYMKFQSKRSLALHLESKHGIVNSTSISGCQPNTSSLPIRTEQRADESTNSLGKEDYPPQRVSPTSTSGSPFSCSKCNMKFLSSKSLNIHLEAKHGQKKVKAVNSNILLTMWTAGTHTSKFDVNESDGSSVPNKSNSVEKVTDKPTNTVNIEKSSSQSSNASTSSSSQFSCSKCGMRFLSISSLNIHLEAKHGQKKVNTVDSDVMSPIPKTGPITSKLVQPEVDVGCGIKESNGDRKIRNKPANAVNIENSTPQSSNTSMLSSPTFKCPKCSMKFLFSKSLDLHLELKHGQKKVNTAFSNDSPPVTNNGPLADKLVVSEDDFGLVPNEWSLPASAKQEVKCSDCDMKFLSPKSLKVHKEAKHCKGNAVSSYESRLLTNKSNGSSMWQDKAVSKKKDEKQTTWKKKMKERRKQEKLAKYKCKTCGMGFLKQKSLEKHMDKYSTENHEVYFICFICGHVSTNKDGLRDHLTGKNHKFGQKVIGHRTSDNSICIREISKDKSEFVELPEVLPYTDVIPICSICGECFQSVYKCRSHMKKIHNKDSYMLAKVVENQSFAKNSEFCDECNGMNVVHNVSNCVKFTHQTFENNMKVVFCCPLGCVVCKHVEDIKSHLNYKKKCNGEIYIIALLIQVDHSNLNNIEDKAIITFYRCPLWGEDDTMYLLIFKVTTDLKIFFAESINMRLRAHSATSLTITRTAGVRFPESVSCKLLHWRRGEQLVCVGQLDLQEMRQNPARGWRVATQRGTSTALNGKGGRM
ncbi:hypothetical protein FSP39_016425 [Pinctada imbricata]|uniref:C2H2-type domain-containing protein n=1 Tax=Pinctada imbricata TaxID=66713 RepID=A0AA88YBY6_PINIB|nr:hypothetical protein FSP39_016425 [Pinctada imbricata]